MAAADSGSTAPLLPSLPTPGKQGRLARSKQACSNCHRSKQRCEGPSVCPCHRCVTFGIDCVFPSSAGPVPSAKQVPSASRASGKAKAAATATPSPPPSTFTPPIKYEQPSLSFSNNNGYNRNISPELVALLKSMTSRLESIESTLSRAQLSFPPLTSTSDHHHSTSDHLSPHTSSNQQQLPPFNNNAAEFTSNNPVETAGEAMAVEGLVDLSGLVAEPKRSSNGNGTGGEEANWGAMIKPDVLDRGLLSPEEVESEFQLYFQHIHPWMALLSLETDTQPLAVRERSPILFHSILILTTYYRPRTSSNILLYRAISSILDSILSPIILCPQPDQLNADLVRALYLLLLYKPVQYGALSARGINDPISAEHASKMNVRASWLLRTICIRVSSYIALPASTTKFAQAFSARDFLPIPEDVIQDQRLYFSSIWHSLHGGLQSGTRVDFIPQEALKTSRLFAELRNQPTDLRLSASVELAAVAAGLLSTRKENDLVDERDLSKFNIEMESWEEYWIPLLLKGGDGGGGREKDELAYTTQFPYASFVKVVINGLSFTRWKAEKKDFVNKLSSAGGEGGQLTLPTLGESDYDSIRRAVIAAEGMMLALTIEGRESLRYSGVISKAWDIEGGDLTLDEVVVNRLRWSSDSLTCVVYSYALIFLAKLFNEGILQSNLFLLPTNSPTPIPLSQLDPNDKLCRLLQLGADFLDLVAPNQHHPAIKQAIFLRRIRDAGISGRRGVISAPGSPGLNPVSNTTTTSHHPHTHHDLETTSTNGAVGLSSLHNPSIPSSLSSSYTGFISPPNSHNPHHNRFGHSQSPLPEDPFSALLNGVSPSAFDSQGFFGVELGGLRWDLDDDMALGDNYSSF